VTTSTQKKQEEHEKGIEWISDYQNNATMMITGEELQQSRQIAKTKRQTKRKIANVAEVRRSPRLRSKKTEASDS
jgi:hypothetical protein